VRRPGGAGSALRRAVTHYLSRYIAPLPPAARWNHRGRFAAYVGLTTAVSAALVTLAFLAWPMPGLLALGFVVASALSTFYIVQVVPEGSLWTPADFFTFSAMFILGPPGVITAALGQTLGYSLRRRPPPVRVLYTLNSDLINGMLAWLVYYELQRTQLPGGVFTAALCTGALYECASLFHLMLGTTLGRRQFVGWSWIPELKFTLPFAVGYAWAALGAASLNSRLGAVGISMVAIPVVLFQGFLVYLARAVHLHQLERDADNQERVHLLQELVVKQRGFVADAAHELRTPLTTLAGGLEVLQGVPDMEESQRQELIEDALGGARRLNNLVDSLLELAALDASDRLESVEFDWNDLMEQVAAEMAGRCAPRSLTTVIQPDLGHGFGDVRWLRQLCAILANNVAAHTPPSTHVRLAVGGGVAGAVRIELEDDGPGVPPGMTERIFERFVQIDPSRHGAAPGLGLAIARSIASAHGGSIRAEPVTPHGLRVLIRLPAVERAPDSGGA
jgi:signal transduction histidine kinase